MAVINRLVDNLKDKTEFTKEEVMEALDCPRSHATKVIWRLCKAGQITVIEHNPDTYSVTNKGIEAAKRWR